MDIINNKIGFAPSDIANNINPDYRLPVRFLELCELAVSNNVGLELELEDNFEDLPQITNRPVFLGVHQPSSGIDVIESQKRDGSILKIKRAMLMAGFILADYFTVHLQTKDRWDNLQQRDKYKNISLCVFEELLKFHESQNFNYPILIENLEFPKYPATREEVVDIANYLESITSSPVGMVLDVGHLWRSRNLLAENRFFHQDSCIPYTDYLSSTLDQIGDIVKTIHITGCGGYQTHMLPQIDIAAPKDRTVRPDEYYFRDVAKVVLKFSRVKYASSHDLNIVNEAFGKPYQVVIDNSKAIVEIEDD